MTGLQLTLRELLTVLSDRKLVAIWLTVTAGCILAGPFGTIEASLGLRMVYWPLTTFLATVLSTYTIVSTHMRGPLGWPTWAKSVLGSLTFSVLFAAILLPLTSAFFGGGGLPDYFDLLLYTAPISVAIALTVNLFQGPPAAEAAPDATGRFFKRLKPELGRDLVRLSMQDHYVEVCTGAGHQLVLMRFADALDEIAALPGWRIHRSHWVAEDGIAAMKRADGKTLVVTRDGAELPVSRTYLPVLKEAGVVKRFLG